MKSGKRVEREIHFSGRAAIFVTPHFFQKISGQLALFDKFQEGEIGVHAGRNHVRVYFFAAFEHYALRHAVLDQDAVHRDFGANFHAGFFRRAGNRVGNPAGAAAAETPGAERAVNFSHVMMQQNVSGARRANS